MTNESFVITISHQLGSGGAYVGQKLAEQLHIPFVDREILKKVAEQLNLAEGQLAEREERLSSFWQSFSRIAALSDPEMSITVGRYVPTDKELFELESDYIGRIAEKSSAIIIGRCGRYVLREHPRHLSVFVYAELSDRASRVATLYHISEDEAKRQIENNDRERANYIRMFTKEDWLDARLYDVCANTSHIGLDTTADLIMTCVKAKIQQTQ